MPSTQPPPSNAWRTAWGGLRASQWLHFVVLPLAGLDGAALSTRAGLARALTGAALASGCLGFAYGVNALAERATNRSALKNPLVGVGPLPAAALISALLCALAALALAALSGPLALGATVTSLAAGALYSLGPRMKQLPGLGLLFNTLIFVPLLSVCLDGAPVPAAFWSLAAVFTSLLVQNQLVHEVADSEEDEASGALTTGRFLGPGRARAAAAGAALLAAAVVLGVAPTLWLRLSGTLALIAGGLVAAGAPAALASAGGPQVLTTQSAAERRRAHRWVAAGAGAVMYLVGLST